MGDIQAIRAALAGAAGTITGLRTSSTVLDAISPPTFVVGEVEIDFDEAFGRGLDLLRFKARLYSSRADDRTGQQRLDAFLAGSGASSVKAALETDRTLGGIAQTLLVVGVKGYGAYEVAQVTYLGAEFAINVWARG